MKRIVLAVATAGGLLLVAATSRSDTTPPESTSPGMPTSEPASAPLGTTPRWLPFTSYDSGPQEGTWSYDALSATERAAVDGLDPDGAHGPGVQAIYAAAAEEQFERSAGALAQFRLGLENLGDIGVVTGDEGGGAAGSDAAPGGGS